MAVPLKIFTVSKPELKKQNHRAGGKRCDCTSGTPPCKNENALWICEGRQRISARFRPPLCYAGSGREAPDRHSINPPAKINTNPETMAANAVRPPDTGRSGTAAVSVMVTSGGRGN